MNQQDIREKAYILPLVYLSLKGNKRKHPMDNSVVITRGKGRWEEGGGGEQGKW